MRNRPDGFDIYLVNVKTIRTIAHIFVVFSEKLNFTEKKRSKKKENKQFESTLDIDQSLTFSNISR